MNKGFYKDLDTNFERACNMSEQEFSHDELLNLLKGGNIPEKQIAALKLNTVNNEKEAKLLVENLTGCDGKIREAVSLKINQILNNEPEKHSLFIHPKVFADATIDINANICRLVIDSLSILKSNPHFSKIYLEEILSFIQSSFIELDNFIFRDKKYTINKQLFKLYWCLEAIKLFIKDVDENKLLNILERASQEKEYTIREKVAQIIILTDNHLFDNLKNKLKDDENYYVREIFR